MIMMSIDNIADRCGSRGDASLFDMPIDQKLSIIKVGVSSHFRSLCLYLYIIIIFSVYSSFSDRFGLPLHNILSPVLPVMDIFSVDL